MCLGAFAGRPQRREGSLWILVVGAASTQPLLQRLHAKILLQAESRLPRSMEEQNRDVLSGCCSPDQPTTPPVMLTGGLASGGDGTLQLPLCPHCTSVVTTMVQNLACCVLACQAGLYVHNTARLQTSFSLWTQSQFEEQAQFPNWPVQMKQQTMVCGMEELATRLQDPRGGENNLPGAPCGAAVGWLKIRQPY